MKLVRLSEKRLQNVEAGQFIINLFENIEEQKIDLNKDLELPRLFKDLKTELDIYKQALQQIIAQKETTELASLDHQRDLRIGNIRKQILVYQYTEEPEEQKAFNAGHIIMNKYEDIEKANYAAETLGIQNMLTEWKKPENAGAIKTLNLEKHIGRLQKAAEAFDAKFTVRSTDGGAEQVFDTKGIKTAMLESYIGIAAYVSAMAKSKKDNDFYLGLLAQINEIRQYFSDILAKRAGGKK